MYLLSGISAGWWVALTSGSDAVAFLATQDYIWDTQFDMACAMIGAITALLTLNKIHDHQREALKSATSSPKNLLIAL